MQITLKREKETKNTVRYIAPDTPEDGKPPLRMAYVDRDRLTELGNPDELVIELRAAA